MRNSDPTEAIDYLSLSRWFFTSGAMRFRKKLLLLLLLTVLAAFSEGVSLWLIVPVFRAVIPAASPPPNSVGIPDTFAAKLPESLESLFGPDAFLLTMLALMLLLVAAKTVLTLVTNWQTARCQWGLMSDWAKQLLQGYLHKDYLSFLKDKHGAMLGNITIETRIAAIGVRDGITFLSQLILSLAYVVVLFITDWQITLFQLAAIFLLSVATWGFTHRLTSRIGRDVLTAKQRVEADASESLSAFRQLKASALENDAVEKFSEPVDRMAELMTKQFAYVAIPRPVSELLVLMLVIGTVYYMYAFTDVVIASQIPTLTLLLIIANRLFMSLAKLATAYMAFTASLPALELIATQLGRERGERSRPADSANIDLTNGVVFSGVSFRYPDKADRVLDDVNLTIGGGQLTVLVGSSGGGKSTIIDLLLGFIQQEEGTVFMDGQDSRHLDFKEVRKKIGYVSQDIYLFDCSIRENLLIHNPEATEEDMRAVCQQAHIGKLVARLPEGLDTLVGPRGVRLSGGERQRLAIAIALLRDPDLLIFDEATNALDPEAEAVVHQTVRELQDKTVFFVTHRFSPALKPDHVFELRAGNAIKLTDADVSNGSSRRLAW
ncbi:MAG: ABC transporter ATP-binding protein [Woeseiaceae bacterium]